MLPLGHWRSRRQNFRSSSGARRCAATSAARPAASRRSIFDSAIATNTAAVQSGTTGSLQLDVEPRAGDLYVDWFYAGRSEAIAGSTAGSEFPSAGIESRFARPVRNAVVERTIMPDNRTPSVSRCPLKR
jgi:hypothetical protein